MVTSNRMLAAGRGGRRGGGGGPQPAQASLVEPRPAPRRRRGPGRSRLRGGRGSRFLQELNGRDAGGRHVLGFRGRGHGKQHDQRTFFMSAPQLNPGVRPRIQPPSRKLALQLRLRTGPAEAQSAAARYRWALHLNSDQLRSALLQELRSQRHRCQRLDRNQRNWRFFFIGWRRNRRRKPACELTRWNGCRLDRRWFVWLRGGCSHSTFDRGANVVTFAADLPDLTRSGPRGPAHDHSHNQQRRCASERRNKRPDRTTRSDATAHAAAQRR